MATNAARFRNAAGWDKSLIEFGLRRAQGPDGGLSASRYCYIGGTVFRNGIFAIALRASDMKIRPLQNSQTSCGVVEWQRLSKYYFFSFFDSYGLL